MGADFDLAQPWLLWTFWGVKQSIGKPSLFAFQINFKTFFNRKIFLCSSALHTKYGHPEVRIGMCVLWESTAWHVPASPHLLDSSTCYLFLLQLDLFNIYSFIRNAESHTHTRKAEGRKERGSGGERENLFPIGLLPKCLGLGQAKVQEVHSHLPPR